MQVCVQIYVVWDYASRESEETAVHIGTTIHWNNWIAKLAKAYCIHLSRTCHCSLHVAITASFPCGIFPVGQSICSSTIHAPGSFN